MIEKLKLQYENYEDSFFFIDCAFEGLLKTGAKQKQIEYFIHNHFKQHDQCDIIQMKKCSTHWNKVAFDKLNNFDFVNYKYCIYSVVNYRVLCKVMESYSESYNEQLY